MVQDLPTAGLLVFLAVLTLPVLAVTLPFLQGWYMQNQEAIDNTMAGAIRSIRKFNQSRNTTYQSRSKGDSE